MLILTSLSTLTSVGKQTGAVVTTVILPVWLQWSCVIRKASSLQRTFICQSCFLPVTQYVSPQEMCSTDVNNLRLNFPMSPMNYTEIWTWTANVPLHWAWCWIRGICSTIWTILICHRNVTYVHHVAFNQFGKSLFKTY